MEFHEIANLFPLMSDSEFHDLKADISRNGLREPIWTYQGKIIDGRNRWLACQETGTRPTLKEWDGNGSLVELVVSLNLHRRHLNESQRAMVAAKLANMGHGGNRKNQGANLQVDISQQQAASLLNVSERTVASAAKIKSGGSPDLIHKVESGKVSVSVAADIATLPEPEQEVVVAKGEKEILQKAKEIRYARSAALQQVRKEQREEAAKIPPPAGTYRTIVIDPPWPMQKIDRDVRPNQLDPIDYPVMSIEEIKSLYIPSDEDCHIYLWTTQKHLPEAFSILAGWGFRYVFTMVWHKPGGPQPYNLPQYNCEFVLFGRKGDFDFLDTKAFSTCFSAPRREHSRKPDEFYELVARVSPAPRIDYFSREKRDGFEQYGNEVTRFS